jgi:hypothetical protein
MKVAITQFQVGSEDNCANEAIEEFRVFSRAQTLRPYAGYLL